MSPYLKKDLPAAGSASPDTDVPVLTDRLGFPPLEFDTTVPLFDTVTPRSELLDLDLPSVQPVAPARQAAPVTPLRPQVAPAATPAPAPPASSPAAVLRTAGKDGFSETDVNDILTMASLGLPEKITPAVPAPVPAPETLGAATSAFGPEFEQRVIDDVRARLEVQVFPMLQQQLAEQVQQAIQAAIPASLVQFRTLAAAAVDDAIHREFQRLRRR